MKPIRQTVHLTLVLVVAMAMGSMVTFPGEAHACVNEFAVTHSQWGWVGMGPNGSDLCTVICGPCPGPNGIIGQVTYECDGTVTSWGMTCEDQNVTVTSRRCELCGPEGP
jgi:hypothetical protein